MVNLFSCDDRLSILSFDNNDIWNIKRSSICIDSIIEEQILY